MGNQIRTTILLAVMTALIIWVGQLLGGRQGMIIALIFAAGMNFFSYWYSDKLVLKMYRASEVTIGQAPELYETVQRLTQRAGLPMPKIYVIPQPTPNAFATGRNPEHAVVAVTEGLLKLMNHEEVAGVLAHELAHVKRFDYVLNIIQYIFEIVFFYHPAVWWISNIIKREREYICDDIATDRQHCGDHGRGDHDSGDDGTLVGHFRRRPQS